MTEEVMTSKFALSKDKILKEIEPQPTYTNIEVLVRGKARREGFEVVEISHIMTSESADKRSIIVSAQTKVRKITS